jgi:hypothetical protein
VSWKRNNYSFIGLLADRGPVLVAREEEPALNGAKIGLIWDSASAEDATRLQPGLIGPGTPSSKRGALWVRSERWIDKTTARRWNYFYVNGLSYKERQTTRTKRNRSAAKS